MISIVEPQEHVMQLWGVQQIERDATYRLMRYTIVTQNDSDVLLHNVVTGQLVLLNQNEVHLLHTLPSPYDSTMDALINTHFLLPQDSDECQQVTALRRVLNTMAEVHATPYVTHYTILPTTACNARCYYCFEQGMRQTTMTEETAQDVVKYIASHCGPSKHVAISWFGGEPTIASRRIDQICEGLHAHGITYTAEMTTNGFLFNEKLVAKAKKLWNLTSLMICVDGIGKHYNNVKAYVNPTHNPYERVMRNIGLLLDACMRVTLRMNVDLHNYQDFSLLVNEALRRYGTHPGLTLVMHPINGAYANAEGVVLHADDDWYTRASVELNGLARKVGLQGTAELWHLEHEGCQACKDSCATITPDGFLVECPEQYGDDQVVGSIWQGVTNPELVRSWKKFANYQKCMSCALYPKCISVLYCNSKDGCTVAEEMQIRQKHAALNKLAAWRSGIDYTKR